VSVIGPVFEPDRLYLTRGRDFKWAYRLVDCDGNPVDFPKGRLYFEFAELGDGLEPVVWEFGIEGDVASLKVESELADLIPDRTRWQLVFLADGEPVGGDPVSLGSVKVQR
jgi:hypothetical protein